MSRSAFFACLTLALASLAQDSKTSAAGTVEFLGHSGQMQFCPTGMCSDEFIRVRMMRLQEIDSSGSPTNNAVPSFASQDFTWSTPEDVNFNGVSATRVNFSAIVKVGSNSPRAPTASFAITSYYFLANTTIEYANTTVEVPANSLKFTVEIKDWPFLSGANSLSFGVDISFKERSKQESDSDSQLVSSGGSAITHLGGTLQVDSPGRAIVDGAARNITSTLTQKNNGVELVWNFPHFSKSVVYDPVLSATDVGPYVDAESGALKASEATFVASLVLMLVAYM